MKNVESIPDITPMLKPSTWGDFATYFFAATGGLFVGGELGMNRTLLCLSVLYADDTESTRPHRGISQRKPQYYQRPRNEEED
jgi:hypothetical protein